MKRPLTRTASLLLLTTLLASVAAGQDRPARLPEFTEGFRAFKLEDWQTAADLMWQAEKRRPEDGELTRVYGRWIEPYLPRYYLGVALYELGCYKAALYRLDLSILNGDQEPDRGTRKQREKLYSIKRQCEEFLFLGVEESSELDCSQWHVDESLPDTASNDSD